MGSDKNLSVVTLMTIVLSILGCFKMKGEVRFQSTQNMASLQLASFPWPSSCLWQAIFSLSDPMLLNPSTSVFSISTSKFTEYLVKFSVIIITLMQPT